MGAGAPPVPQGRLAVEEWRRLDRETRRRLLDGTLPNPDPTTAVIAVGYARARLSGFRRRAILLRLCLGLAAVVTDVVIFVLAGPRVPPQYVAAVAPVMMVCFLLVVKRRRVLDAVRLTRMETVLASRLWQSEIPDPAPFAAPAPQGRPLSVRYVGKYLARVYGTVFGFVTLVSALSWLQQSLLAIPVTALMVFSLGLMAYNVLRRVRPWLPVLTLDSGGVLLRGRPVRVPWSEITEIRVMPVKGGRRPTNRWIVAFVIRDPESVLNRLPARPRKAARRAQTAYGTPLVIADIGLDHSAEDIAQAAKGFTAVPVRRFGG